MLIFLANYTASSVRPYFKVIYYLISSYSASYAMIIIVFFFFVRLQKKTNVTLSIDWQDGCDCWMTRVVFEEMNIMWHLHINKSYRKLIYISHHVNSEKKTSIVCVRMEQIIKLHQMSSLCTGYKFIYSQWTLPIFYRLFVCQWRKKNMNFHFQ